MQSDGTENELINSIKVLHAEMRELILRAGVKEKKYDRLIKRILKFSVERRVRIHLFLQELYLNEYKEVKRIWTLPHMTPEVWDNYSSLFGETKLREQLLLNRANGCLRRRFNQFKMEPKRVTEEIREQRRQQIDPEQDPESSELRSEETGTVEGSG